MESFTFDFILDIILIRYNLKGTDQKYRIEVRHILTKQALDGLKFWMDSVHVKMDSVKLQSIYPSHFQR